MGKYLKDVSLMNSEIIVIKSMLVSWPLISSWKAKLMTEQLSQQAAKFSAYKSLEFEK